MLKPDIPVMNSNLNETTRKTLLEQIKQANTGRVWIALDREALFHRKDHLKRLESNLRFFEESGFETGVWLQAFGFGEFLSYKDCGWTRLRSVTDKTKENDALCPEDPDFMAAYLALIKEIAALSPELIMIDDDLCLSVRPGLGCFCDRHIKLLEREVGQIDDLTKIFVGGKNKYRDAWYRVTGNTMRSFCQRVRDAVNEIDPQIRVGLCAGYTSWDIEGTDPIEMATILAGDTAPFFRLTAAPYWAAQKRNRFPGQRLSAIIENARNQIAWSKNSGIEFFAEADSFPRPCYETPAMLIENFDIAMHASGTRSLKYLFDYHSSPEYEKQYLKIHVRNLPLYERIENAFAGTTPCGVQVYRPPHRITDALLPQDFVGEKPIMRSYFSTAAAMLACHAIPVYYGEGSPCAMLFGDDAQYFKNNHQRVVLDLPAARILSGRGIDVGIESIGDTVAPPTFELFENERVPLFATEDAPFPELRLKSGATVKSRYDTGTVASFEYQGFLILNLDAFRVNEASPLYCSYARGKQLQAFFGTPFPAVLGYADLYTVCAERENGHVALLQNLSVDPVFDFDILLPKACRSVRIFGADGKLCNGRIRITGELAPQASLLLEIEYQ